MTAIGGNQAQNQVRAAALDFMRNRVGVGGQPQKRAALEARERASIKTSPPFSELPQYRQVLAHQAAGRQLRIENPFFRPHDGSAGATTTIDGRTLLNFASYDYLGLNQHPALRSSASEAIAHFGVSASASRLVAGERAIHLELEETIASFYGVDAAVAMVSGYLTNVTTIACLVGPSDLVLHDELIHNSVLAGAQFSGVTRRGFRHNDLDDLERQLIALAPRHRRVLVVVEGLYSMDGDIADLPGLIRLKSSYGFWLMVDEAHALGVLGETGRGSYEHFGCDPKDIDIWMGTLSKTTASCGGYIAGSHELIAVLKGYAGGFVYSVGMAPALAAAARESFRIIAREPERTQRLKLNGRRFLDKARAIGLDTGVSAGYAVTPVVVGDSVRAVYLSNELFEAGINVLPILFPAVPERQARLRFFITCEHSEAQIDEAVRLTAEKLASLVDRRVGMSSIDAEEIARQIAMEGDLRTSR